jgi:sporulation protein YlmC with PRC-barrel domain
MKLSEVVGLRVKSESGRELGKVHDVRGELTSRSLKITGLVVGRLGALERLGFGAPHNIFRVAARDVIPWEQVVRLDRRGVVVKD